jgi:hypothetical protein
MDLEVVGTLQFLSCEESNKISGTILFGSSHQVMKLILFANPIKDQVIYFIWKF